MVSFKKKWKNKTINICKNITYAIFLLTSCSTKQNDKNVNNSDYIKANKYLENFIELAGERDIYFNRSIVFNFTNIEKDNVIGTCTTYLTHKEIDIDIDFWNKSSDTQKTTLLWHEASHCYCNRDHDFNNGIMYPDDSIKSIIQGWFRKTIPYRPEGYFEDSCPMSIMYPKIIDDYCFRVHYNEYVEEMFNRCDAY